MSDSPTGGDPASIAIGAAIVGLVGLVIAAVRGLFVGNVAARDKAADEMRADVKAILLELKSMHDEQTRQRAEITGIQKAVTMLEASCKANHDRIDALVTHPPKRPNR